MPIGFLLIAMGDIEQFGFGKIAADQLSTQGQTTLTETDGKDNPGMPAN